MKFTRIIRAAFASVLAAAALAVTTAQATPINVPNASFEDPTTPTEGDGAPIPGWVFSVQGGYLYGTAPISQSFKAEGAASGNNYAFLFNDGAGTTDTITSAASLGIIEPNMDYTLTVAIGNVGGSDSVSNHYPGNVSFSLLANGVAFATDTVPNGTVPDATFEDFSLTFQTPSSGSIIGENLTIQLASLPTPGPGAGPAFDNVTLDATSVAVAPEPSSGALLLSGLLILGWFIRRKTTARRTAVTITSLALATTLVHAAVIDVPNASFESPSAPASTTTNEDIIPDWVFVTNDKGFTFGTSAISSYFTSEGAASGNNFAFIENFDTTTKETLTSAASLGTITPLTTYTLTVAVGNVKGDDSSLFGAPGNVSFSLLANGVAFATNTVTNGTVPNDTFEDFSLTYTTPATASIIGEDLTIQLASLAQTAWGYEAAFDNVTLDATPEDSDPPAVPEPRSFALLVSGCLILWWLAGWQRRATTI